MTRSKSAMDSADNVQKFIAQMKPSNGNNSWSASAKPAAAQQNGHATPNDDEIGPILVSQPIDIPARAARTASPELHPLPSPHVGGLLAPQNTPYTRPVSPLAMPAELAAHNQVVSGAFSDFVNNVEGRPLSEFFWAPAQVAARAAATPRGGSRTTPRNLTPTSIVTPNPAINGSFERMSFKAADQDQGHKIGGNIFGDRNTRSALTNAGAKQPSASPVYVTKSAMQSAQPVGVWLADQPGNSSMGRQPFSATKNASQPTDPVSAEPASPSTQISMGKQPLPTMKLTTQPTEPVSAEASSPSTSSIPMIKAASWLGRTLSRGSKDPQKAKASTDNSLFSNLHALEASGGLSPDQLAFFKNVTNQAVANDNAQPTKADEPPEPVAEKPTEMPTKANGVKNAVDSEESMMGKAEQADALVNKLHLKEKELKDLGASNAAMHAGLADLRDNLRQKEKAWKDYEVVWAGKEAKLEEEITELRAELTRIEGVIEKLRIKQKELKALDISNAGQGGLLVKVIQDTRHELTHKEEAYKDVEALNGRKQAKLEEEVKELRAALQTMTTKKVAPESKVPVNATKIAKKKGKVDGNLEHQTFFSKWPQSEKRDRAPAKNRKVILKNLPRNATLSFVASIVYFGPIEEIYMRSDNTATVKFLNPADCQKYHDDTSNGIVYKKDIQGREIVVFVELAKDVDVIGGLLQGWIETGASRCVRIVGVEEEWGKVALKKLAEAKGRVLEGISDGVTPGGSRVVLFRFGKIDHAVAFKASLARDEEFEQCNIHYAMDPCEIAKEVHFGN